MAFLFIFQLLTNKISDNNIVKRETYNSMQGGILTNVGIKFILLQTTPLIQSHR
jgi:hypothetical protein